MNIEIRDATRGDASAELFHSTVPNVNVSDYGSAQGEAWAGPARDPEMWEGRIAADASERRTFVGVEGGRVVGFAELEGDGHVDTLAKEDL